MARAAFAGGGVQNGGAEPNLNRVARQEHGDHHDESSRNAGEKCVQHLLRRHAEENRQSDGDKKKTAVIDAQDDGEAAENSHDHCSQEAL